MLGDTILGTFPIAVAWKAPPSCLVPARTINESMNQNDPDEWFLVPKMA